MQQVRVALATLIAVKELENEGLTGKIGFKEIRAKLEVKDLVMTREVVWELAMQKFLKHNKTGFVSRAGYNVVYHLWTTAKDKKHSVEVFSAAVKKYKESVERKNNGNLDKKDDELSQK